MKSLMAELPRLIVIHAAQQQYHFLRPLGRIGTQLPFLRLDQFHQIRQLFNKAGNILCLHSKHSGIPLCQHAGFIFTQVCGDKVLPVQVLWLDNIPIADNKAGRTIQHMKQAKHIRGNICFTISPFCSAGFNQWSIEQVLSKVHGRSIAGNAKPWIYFCLQSLYMYSSAHRYIFRSVVPRQ